MAAKKKEKEGPSIWSSILAEARHAATLPDSLLLVLGRPEIGKRTFLQSLQHHAVGSHQDKEDVVSHSRAVALDYAYINVRDPEHDTDGNPEARCSCLMLEDMHYENLVISRLTAAELKNYLALICVDMKEPWTIMKDVNTYLEFLQRMTSKLLGDLPLEEQDALRTKIENTVRKAQNKDGKGDGDKAAAEGGGDKKEEEKKEGGDDEKKEEKKDEEGKEGEKKDGENPLAPGVLTYNLGIPVVVCVLRSDCGQTLQKGFHETILCHLRSTCLSYGASLTYLMAQGKTPANIEVTYDWLVHCLYNYPFNHPTNLDTKDSIFVPGGADSQKAIQDAAKAIPGGSLEQPFETIVTPPTKTQRSQAPSDEVDVEDMNAFLKRAKQQLKTGVSSGGPSSKLLMGAAGPNTKMVEKSLPTAGGEGAAKAGSPGAGGPSDNSSLANFFQDLLTRGQGGAKKAAAPPGKGAAIALAARAAGAGSKPADKDSAQARAARLEQTQDLKKELERLKQQSKAKLENVKRTSIAAAAGGEEKKDAAAS